jgi:hypothetical protein
MWSSTLAEYSQLLVIWHIKQSQGHPNLSSDQRMKACGSFNILFLVEMSRNLRGSLTKNWEAFNTTQLTKFGWNLI